MRHHVSSLPGSMCDRQMATGRGEEVLDPLGDTRSNATSRGNKWLFNAKASTIVGTWNVKTLWKDGSLELLANELY